LNAMEEALEITGMRIEHVSEVERIEKLCFSSPWSYDSIAGELENPHAVFYVALLDGKVSGYAGMMSVAGEGYIANIAVDPLCRRKGIAASLLKKLEGYALDNGLEFLSLEVRQSNAAAISAYEDAGYKTVGKRRNFYTDPPEDGLIMTKRCKETADMPDIETEVGE
jgi:ribosomal-protein-alanine N-acetyltransferase